MFKNITYVIFLCFCISAKAQKLNKEDLYADAICRLHKIQLLYAYLQPIITQYFIDNKSEIWLLFLIAHSKR